MSAKSSIFNNLQLLMGFDQDEELAYQKDQFNKSKTVLRGAILFSILLFGAFAWLDVYIAETEYKSMWVFRLIYCFYAFIIFAYSYTVFFESLHQLVMGSLVLVACICILGIMIIPMESVNSNVYYTSLILLVFFNFTLTNMRFSYASIIAVIIIILYLFTCIYFLEVLKDGWLSTNGTLFTNNTFFLLMSAVLGAVVNGIIETYKRNDFVGQVALKKEQLKSNQLLLNILPNKIADQLKNSTETIADEYNAVSVLFADLVGFTNLASRKKPKDLVDMLDHIFSKFDFLADKYGLEKIKTIGDAYMVAGGLLGKNASHAIAMGDMALSMMKELEKYNRRFDENLNLRIGIHIGPVVAGVIGSRKFSYDLWGDSVNVASRMESSGEVGKIQVSSEMYQALKSNFNLSARGAIKVKGKGELYTYFLNG